MKTLLLLLITSSAFASPLSQMRSRINDYQEMKSPDHCSAAKSDNEFSNDDYGLMASVECELTCRGQKAQRQRSSGSFIPRSYGLYPGDGSNNDNTLWRSVAMTLQVWSEEVCLIEAREICGGLEKIAQSEVIEVESGEWKLNHKLGCDEKVVTLSPFDQTVKAKRLSAPLVESLEIANKSHALPVLTQVYALAEKPLKKDCKHEMEADLCFGDCVYEINQTDWKETLATPESLGQAKIRWCMDEIVPVLKAQENLAPSVKAKICEAYFWSSMMHSHGAGSSCAALRGTHQCEKFIQSF